MKTKTSPIRNSMNRSRLALLLIPVAFACFALAPQARATCQKGCLTNENTVLGEDALISLTIGTSNTAMGFNALFSNTAGSINTAIGDSALFYNTNGIANTAIGWGALLNNTMGSENTAIGEAALFDNNTGSGNTAIGQAALHDNITGSNNTATGLNALFHNNTGSGNTATGLNALVLNASGFSNTATGNEALKLNTTGNNNTAIGHDALVSNRTGNGNIGLGVSAGGNLTDGDNNIDIGNLGVAGEANTIRVGRVGTHNHTFIAGINGVTVAGGVAVIIDSSGHLGTVVSSERFKEAIGPMDKASEAILALKPVTFRYKHELDPAGIAQFGLVAEDVEKVNPDLVARDEQGKPYMVRYEAVNAMLLNEFLKGHRKVAEQEATITRLKAELRATATQQQKQIDALTAGLQKVSAQLELSKPVTQTALNNQ